MKAIWIRWIEKPFAWPLILMAVILAASAVGFAHFEAGTQSEPVGYFEGLWWAMVTLFTVGYGDFAPRTVPGRVLGMVVMASGIGLVSTLTGSMASAMVERRSQKRRGLLPVTVENHILIMGWNSHGAAMLDRLRLRPEFAGSPVVLAADIDPSVHEHIAESLGLGDALKFVRGATDRKSVLERANPAKARLAYILSSEDLPPEEADNHSILTALTFRPLAPRVTLYAEAVQDKSQDHLHRAGVNKVLLQGDIAGKALAFMAAHPVMHDLLGTFMSGASDGGSLVHYRPMTAEEKAMGWASIVQESLSRAGQLPIAVCRLPRELNLTDVLDTSQALDAYILELFQAAGKETSLGRQKPRVVVNPGPAEDLSGFDGLIYMDRPR